MSVLLRRLFSGRGLYYSAGLCIVLAVTCFAGVMYLRDYVAANYWPRTNAHVASEGKRVRYKNGDFRYRFEASYTVDGRTYTHTFFFRHQPGEFEAIAYNPRDPSESEDVGRFDSSPGWWLLLGGCSLACTIGIAWSLTGVLRGKD